VKHFLYNFDQFGQRINLNIKKNEVHHTFIGSIVSLLIITFISFSFSRMVIDMIQMTSPNVISNTEFTKDPEVSYFSL